jgi:hypothetical protein
MKPRHSQTTSASEDAELKIAALTTAKETEDKTEKLGGGEEVIFRVEIPGWTATHLTIGGRDQGRKESNRRSMD